MLFSDKTVADYINEQFEPVWENVRPVPIVRIDFGGGREVVRTLHGNIATYVCTADGVVLDILPGIYAPREYVRQLRDLALLPKYLRRAAAQISRPVLAAFEPPPLIPARAPAFVQALADYHRRQAASLAGGTGALEFKVRPGDMTKAIIESRLEYTLVPRRQVPTGLYLAPEAAAAPALKSGGELAEWLALADDTRLNETVRRLAIHEKLAQKGPVQAAEIKKWLYREVLHADLDDPYLGLGPALFGSYPFKPGI